MKMTKIENNDGLLSIFVDGECVSRQSAVLNKIHWTAADNVDQNLVKSIEDQISCKFPREYLDFLQHCCGDRPKVIGNAHADVGWACDTRLGGEGELDPIVEPFFPLDENFLEHYHEVKHWLQECGIKGKKLVPIYCTITGEYLCLDFTDNRWSPSICFLDTDDLEQGYEGIFPVAENLAAYLLSLIILD